MKRVDQFTDRRRISHYLADIAASNFLLNWAAKEALLRRYDENERIS